MQTALTLSRQRHGVRQSAAFEWMRRVRVPGWSGGAGLWAESGRGTGRLPAYKLVGTNPWKQLELAFEVGANQDVELNCE